MFASILGGVTLCILGGYLFRYRSIIRFRWSKEYVCFVQETLQWWESILYYSTIIFATICMGIQYYQDNMFFLGLYLPTLVVGIGQANVQLSLY